MSDVAIVGIGMHPFGRHEGVSGMEQGAHAVREACKDAGVEWQDIQFAFGGSSAAGAPDTMVSLLGLTGLQFINVQNGCATGGSALFSAYNTIMSGAYDLGIAIGFDKHERGAFRIQSGSGNGRDWYGGSGMALTTQFFGMKINRYMQEYGITQNALARVASKAFHNGALNEMAWRRQPFSEEEVLQSQMLSYPLTQYMFCSPGEGGVALILARADQAHKYTEKPIFLNSAVVRSRRFGSFEVLAPSRPRWHSSTAPDRRWMHPKRRSRWQASAPRTSIWLNCRTPSPAPKSCTWPRTASANMANRNRCWRKAKQRSTDVFR